ncbi:MFS transporter [Gordonia sp. (in: high G+C Gram-positive bacteria)]|uniref:MFS transporter n=1 Tax=Gordonia sp. (in: high G+C Gram-positive bacteria) TaxID=84139 RepID=UPI003529812B
MTDQPVPDRPTAPGEQRRVLSAMCLSLVLVVASVSAVNLALPDLAVAFAASNSALTWIADGYTVALAAFVLPMGALGDRVGRRTVLLAGTAVFAAGSVAAAVSGTSTFLIASRVVMGLGAAMIMPGTLSTITATFPADRRARGVAIWSGFAAAGAIIGLIAAGALLEVWSWRSIFYTSAAVACLALIAAAMWSPNTRDRHPPRVDVLGTALTVVGIGTLVFAIIEGSDRGWTETVVVATFVVCAVSLAAYAAYGLRTHEPLLDPRLFGLPGFRAGSISITVQFMAVFGFFFVGLQYLQLILGYSPLRSAIALVPVALAVLPVSVSTPAIVRRLGLNVTMCLGLLLLAAGLACVAALHADSGYLPFLLGLIVSGIGIGVTGSTGTSAIVGSLSADQQGIASAVNDTTREVGSAIGIALMGAVFSSRYAASLPDLSRLPADASKAVRDSAAAGLEVAARMGPSGAGLTHAVRTAFMDGLSAALIAVVIPIVLTAFGALLRAPRKSAARDAD